MYVRTINNIIIHSRIFFFCALYNLRRPKYPSQRIFYESKLKKKKNPRVLGYYKCIKC